MKIRSYKILFRIFSYLSDKTNGARFFVKYKLLLGTLIIGLASTVAGCKSKKAEITCYDMPADPEPIPQIMCYEPIAPQDVHLIHDSILIKARVLDHENKPVIGISVYVKNEYRSATQTDVDGNFNLKVRVSDTLMFTSTYKPIYIPVSKLKIDEINEIILKEK